MKKQKRNIYHMLLNHQQELTVLHLPYFAKLTARNGYQKKVEKQLPQIPKLRELQRDMKQEQILRLSPCIAPYKVAILLLVKNKDFIVDKAREIYSHLSQKWKCFMIKTEQLGADIEDRMK